MQYFSLYDLLISEASKNGLSESEVISHLRKHKITKAELFSLRNLTYLPDSTELKQSIQALTGMSELEISLSLGHIPVAYRDSFFSNVRNIANLLKKKEEKTAKGVTPFFSTEWGMLYNADCLQFLKTLPSNYVDLIFADPPFNLKKSYGPGINDNLSISAYLNWTIEWLDECVRILKNGGRIFVYNIPKWSVYIASHLGRQLNFWDWIAIDMKFSLPISGRLYPAHYSLVSYVKGEKPNTYHNQRIPMQTCRHCGGEIKDYGGYKSKMNSQGVNISDVWSDIYPVRHRSSKNRSYNELSVKLLDRVISMSTNENDLVLDPFGGSGTTYAVAQLLKRRWIGCELGDCNVIKNRLLNPSKDIVQLERIYQEKNHLFTVDTKRLREKNGFWLPRE